MSPCPVRKPCSGYCRRGSARPNSRASRSMCKPALRASERSQRLTDSLRNLLPPLSWSGRHKAVRSQMAKQEPGRRTDSRGARLRGAGGTGSGRMGVVYKAGRSARPESSP